MKIEYVCHACLLIDTGDVMIATDPWFRGSSYCQQWYLFPRPVNADVLQNAEVVLLSHGHEDHFHEESLRTLPKTAKALYPYSWYGGAKEFLTELGFREVIEAHPSKTYKLTPKTSVSYLVNSLDSIVVIESGGSVLVNINDALHSYPAKIIDIFVRAIRQRWPKIDTILCGFGGANYFPNAVHCLGKDDVEIAEVREQLFAQNFCRIAHDLQPRVAVPFAADFALLGDKQRWINEVRFPRTRLPQYYRSLYGDADGVRIEPMYSGDVLNGDELIRSSPYREQVRAEGLTHLLEGQYAAEIASKRTVSWISESESEALRTKMEDNIRVRASLFDSKMLGQSCFCVKVVDVRERNCFNIRFNNREPVVERDERSTKEAVLSMETSSQILLRSFGSAWGGDAFTIGYGCEIQVFDPQTIKSGVDITCVRLLTRQPPASRHWRVEPIRIARHLLSSPTTRAWALRAAFNRSSEYSEKRTNDVMREWLFRSKCEVCRACDLPLLDEPFAAKL